MESLPTATVKAQTQSKKDNEEHAKEVATKIKKSQTFDGNDNPGFPKPIGKGEKVTRKNTPEQDKVCPHSVPPCSWRRGNVV